MALPLQSSVIMVITTISLLSLALASQPPVRAEDPAYLEDPRSSEYYTIDEVEENSEASRKPERRQPARQTPAPRSESTADAQPVATQPAFFEITPTIGSISIKDKAAFSVGMNVSFRLAENTPFYFEPGVFITFLPGDNGSNDAALLHIDGGFRYDWAISGNALVPFVKVAAGPTISSSNTTVVNGETVSDGYLNLFAGGGAKLLINPSIAARADVGLALQGSDTGLYAMGAIALPL